MNIVSKMSVVVTFMVLSAMAYADLPAGATDAFDTLKTEGLPCWTKLGCQLSLSVLALSFCVYFLEPLSIYLVFNVTREGLIAVVVKKLPNGSSYENECAWLESLEFGLDVKEQADKRAP